jgi:hypothetical protein
VLSFRFEAQAAVGASCESHDDVVGAKSAITLRYGAGRQMARISDAALLQTSTRTPILGERRLEMAYHVIPLPHGIVNLFDRDLANSRTRTARASFRSRNSATYRKRHTSTRRNYSNGIRVRGHYSFAQVPG